MGYGILYLAGEDPSEFTRRQMNRLGQDQQAPGFRPGVGIQLAQPPTAEPVAVERPVSQTPPSDSAPPELEQVEKPPPNPPPSPDESSSDSPITFIGGESWWVYNTNNLGLRVRSSPDIVDINIVGKVSEGTGLQLSGPSQSASGYTWRQVRLEGWSAADWLSPSPSSGGIVQVKGTSEAGLRVRTSPQLAVGNILGKVFDGTQLKVLDGPQSANGYQWWRVRLDGWSAVEFLRDFTLPPAAPPLNAPESDRRVIIVQGICSSTADFSDPGHWSPKLKRWLSQELGLEDWALGDPRDQIIEFSYSPDGWDKPYTQAETLLPVGNGAANFTQIYLAYPDARFDIIAHSLGGVVALNALQFLPDLKQRTNSVVTVGSPLRGVSDPGSWFHANSGFYCGDSAALFRTIRHPVYADLDPGSQSIRRIVEGSWRRIMVATVTNTHDLVVPSSTAVLEGPSVHCWSSGASAVLDPARVAREFWAGHWIILEELPQWFRLIEKAAHVGVLREEPC